MLNRDSESILLGALLFHTLRYFFFFFWKSFACLSPRRYASIYLIGLAWLGLEAYFALYARSFLAVWLPRRCFSGFYLLHVNPPLARFPIVMYEATVTENGINDQFSKRWKRYRTYRSRLVRGNLFGS